MVECSCTGCIQEWDWGEGLRLLHDDNACCEIPKHIGDGGVADIYVEVPAVQYAKDSDWELEFSEADDEQEEIYVDVPSSIYAY